MTRSTKAILLDPENKAWFESLKEYPRETPNDIMTRLRLRSLQSIEENKTIIA